VSAAANIVLAGVMLRCEKNGNITHSRGEPLGLFIADVRVLSALELRINGQYGSIASEKQAFSSRSVVLVPELARHQTCSVVATRVQSIVPGGLDDEIILHNVTNLSASVAVEVEFRSDFADPFMLRSDGRTFARQGGRYHARIAAAGARSMVEAGYSRELDGRRFTAEVAIAASDDPTIELSKLRTSDPPGASFSWALELKPGERRRICISARSNVTRSVAPLTPSAPPTSVAQLVELRRQALADLETLRMPFPSTDETPPELSDVTIVAAGAPWFLTLFGRDSMVTSLLAEADLPGLADGNLRALRATQSAAYDPTRAAEPGKMIHELRHSELAVLGEVPYDRYYGSVDATPLYLWALAELGSRRLQQESEATARSAIEWMLGPGGLATTGFLRYVSDPNGLFTQGWKDSADAVAHADGQIAAGAIALCEVQGYAWRALTGSSRLARQIWGDTGLAERLKQEASELRVRFREQFWTRGGFPALALDGNDERVEVVASNAGHLLFSGILDQDEAALVTERLLRADMFTGWGVRTLSSREARYNPLAYHNGAVWPHDTAIAAIGMCRYGLFAEARVLARALVDSAASFDNQPPELFGGFDREQYLSPVRYAKAAVPQAWASAAMLAAVRVLSDAVPRRADIE